MKALNAPCRKGHTSGRQESTGKCIECQRLKKIRRRNRKLKSLTVRVIRVTVVVRAKKKKKKWRGPYKKVAELSAAQLEKRRSVDRKRYLRRKKNPKFRLRKVMGTCIRASLLGTDKAGRGWQDLVEYTSEQLKTHLERQFLPWMSWKNYGTKWHIDHIVPLSHFDFQSARDPLFRIAWGLTNLRPLSATKNLKKGGKHEYLF